MIDIFSFVKQTSIFTFALIFCLICTGCGKASPLIYSSETVDGKIARVICEEVERTELNGEEYYAINGDTAAINIVSADDETILYTYPFVSPTALSYRCDLSIEITLYMGEEGRLLAAAAVPINEGQHYLSLFYCNGADFCVLANFFSEVKSIEVLNFDGVDKISITDKGGEYCEYVINEDAFTVTQAE